MLYRKQELLLLLLFVLGCNVFSVYLLEADTCTHLLRHFPALPPGAPRSPVFPFVLYLSFVSVFLGYFLPSLFFFLSEETDIRGCIKRDEQGLKLENHPERLLRGILIQINQVNCFCIAEGLNCTCFSPAVLHAFLSARSLFAT